MLKYEFIYNSLKQQIFDSKLISGAKLPSIRTLAQQYQCNKSTILTALDKLEAQHLVYSIPKSGYYVLNHQLPHLPSSGDVIDFATASPAWHAFPYHDFQHCMNKAIDTYKEQLFQYGTAQGLPSLIHEAQRLLTSYQVFSKPEHIFINSGVQEALALLSVMPFPNGRQTIVVEQPSYHLYMHYLNLHRLPAIGIKRTTEGIDLNELEEIFRTNTVKFFYTMPRFHNPLGTSYSKQEKEGIVKLANKYDVYIVEDDFLADFEHDKKADPLFAYDLHSKVIYLKSFSKIIFPGLRIGFTVLPAELSSTFRSFKTVLNIDSSMISQAALELYIKSGMFHRYRKQISDTYIARSKALQQSLQTHLSAYPSSNQICMHSHIMLPKQVNLNALIANLHDKKIELTTVDSNYLQGMQKERILKLNVSNVEQNNIDYGIKTIAEALQDRQHYF